MPDVQSIPLGGGTVVHQQANRVKLGPDSVGHNLTKEGLAFGGSVLTVSDLLIASGQLNIGNPSSTKDKVSPEVITTAKAVIKRQLEGIIDKWVLRQSFKHLTP